MTSSEEASELIARRFTRWMNAAVSPLGYLTDLTWTFAAMALLFVCLLWKVRYPIGGVATLWWLLPAALPALVNGAVSLHLRGSRQRVISFLSELPFPVYNLNALLAGLGEGVEVSFAGRPFPDRPALLSPLAAVSDDILIFEVSAEQCLVRLKLGVIDSKRFPLRSTFARWQRFETLVRHVLVPLHRQCPIARVVMV